MKKAFTIFALTLIIVLGFQIKTVNGQTYCNPLNLSYRFCLDQPSRREAADPTIVLYKDNYYLFASKSGGYWYSSDLLAWKLVTTTDLPLENYAPTAVVIGDWLYFLASQSNTIFRSNDPVSGKWEVYNSSFPLSIVDPAIFANTDGRIYFYYGCSNNSPLQAVELDVNNKLNPKGKPVVCFNGNPLEHGWERPGDYNDKTASPWIEGSWMNKYKGKYYYQYAGPGTEFKSYADGVYVSDNPLGPFTYAANNPFSSKPEGFASGAGHGSTFADKYGNWWHIATMTISVKHMFERRLGLFPSGFDNEGNLFTTTDFGDYPYIMPNHKYTDVSELNPGWSLLSYNKTAEASSSIATNPIAFAFDENIRTYWSAQTGKKGEWLSVDLGSLCTINAIQINFAENDTKLLGREGVHAHQYLVEYSADKQNWKTLSDKTSNIEDLTHQYEVMSIPVKARYVKITNYRVPDGTFAISGLRIFGSGTSPKPTKVTSFSMTRDSKDPRNIILSWEKQANATGYNIRYGVQKDKLYHSYQVYKNTSVTIRSLDKDKTYWFEIDSFGENGVTSGDSQNSH
jgi:xylan 1,4-beta-xylosidase